MKLIDVHVVKVRAALKNSATTFGPNGARAVGRLPMRISWSCEAWWRARAMFYFSRLGKCSAP